MDTKSVIESILFISGEPMTFQKLSKLTGKKVPEIENIIFELSLDCKKRGIRIVREKDRVQFVSAPENSEYVEKFIKSELREDLSKASLETLAIVAYRGPVTRVGIDWIRGVNSSFILRNLMVRGLLERISNPKDSRSYLYKISLDFLKSLGLEKIEDLPSYDSMKNELKTVNQ